MNYDFNEIDYFTNITDTNPFLQNTNNQMVNNINNNSNSNNQLLNSQLFNPYEGYIKGNLFKNLYKSYKNFKPIDTKITNEHDELLLNVNQLSFACHELNLLLDNYPNNSNALNLFNRYLEMKDKAIKDYERRYGPLEVTNNVDTSIPFAWENDKWPWEV